MEREREERAGETTSFFIFLPSEVEREREGRGQGKEVKEGGRGDRGKAVRAQTRMDPLLFHGPQRKEDQEHFGPHGQGWSRGTQW